MFLCTIPAVMYLDRWGRRKTLMYGATGMSIAQLIVATLYAVYQDSFSQHPSAGWTACVFVWVYIATFAFSIACVNWCMPSEMFPPAIRGKAVGVAIAFNYLSNFIVALITPLMLESITFGTFYFFLVFWLILGGWTYFCVPETKSELSLHLGGHYSITNIFQMYQLRKWIIYSVAMKARGTYSELPAFVHSLGWIVQVSSMIYFRSRAVSMLRFLFDVS